MKAGALPREKRGNVPTVCVQCGDDFKTYQCYIADGRGKYCKKECGYMAMRKYPVGQKKCTLCKKIKSADRSYFYSNRSKNDKLTTECIDCITKLNHEKTAVTRKQFVNSLGNICSQCGITNDDHSFFDIDHINPLFKSALKRSQYDYSDKENLQLLCPNCHRMKTLKDRGWR